MDRVTGSTANLPISVLADNHTSLMHGWVPAVVQAVSAALLLMAVGRRSLRWRLVWLPVAATVGAALAAMSHWYIENRGLADDPAPQLLWWWVGRHGCRRRRVDLWVAHCALVAARRSACCPSRCVCSARL